ncbi:electron transport complex subunit RsxC [Gallibacterium anatis]|uniref:Ion-translocating oxidoreductase complex subunit C n=1 Tax=Gallibacterium anatis TaxID=750 RepID=A0AAX3XCU1_9PAST|nr:electron transport complex subunit RsxC [Gallibacterium anatis]MDK9429924.1 electron transport complex subunit RsxC [Gallibacterium anatis]WIM78874.1 electron transport complex subunit RsxC [Gallibacterium anatis]
MLDDVLTRINKNRLWDFPGGIHPPEMKQQSNGTKLSRLKQPDTYYIALKQHAGKAGQLLVQVGDYVLKGQALTQGDDYRTLPVHAPTSGTITAIGDYASSHPSGLPETTITLQADGKDQWRDRQPIEDFLTVPPEQLLQKIYQAGIAGLGGAVFPTASKIASAENKVKLLIINGAECEPYITCDDRLMRDRSLDILEGIRILRYILRPQKVVLAIEDNKAEAIEAMQQALSGANDIEIRVIPTKYPSGAAKQLIQVLTGLEVPNNGRSSQIGVLMNNVATAFAVKKAIIDDEPLIERVVTLTGDKIPQPRNVWARIGTPIYHLLQQAGYQYDDRFPVFMGGPMMGFILPNLNSPVTKVTNCLIAPDHFEYQPPPQERNCIRCSACSDHCPIKLMPQQLYWFARSEDHEKSEQYNLKDCIECGVCAYVCPSNIPLIQYFRQEKAKIAELKLKAKLAEEAKVRFEAKQARMEREKQERDRRTQLAAEARRAEMAKQQGIDPVQAALERVRQKQASNATPQIKTITNDKGEILPDNSDIMAARKARRLAKQAQTQTVQPAATATTDKENKQAAIAAAIARAKAKKAQQAENSNSAAESSSVAAESSADTDPRKAAIAAAIARAKAKKAQQAENSNNAVESSSAATESSADTDPRKAAIAAAIARAKAKKAQQTENNNSATESSSVATESSADTDPRKAAIAAAIARAKAKKAQQAENSNNAAESSSVATESSADTDPRKAAIAAAIARAKAKKAQQAENSNSTAESSSVAAESSADTDPRKAAIAAAIARAKAKKAQQAENSNNAVESSSVAAESSEDTDPRKAAIAAAIARAKAKKAQTLAEAEKVILITTDETLDQQQSPSADHHSIDNHQHTDPRKAAIAAAIARAKAKKVAREGNQDNV